MEIRIFKSKKILEVWEEDKLVKSYPIASGKNEGHKEKEGDLRTPEGEYKVCVKNPKSKYFLSLGLDYPNLKDAKEGLRKGVISEEEYKQITQAHKENKIPSWKTALGGEIFIHGELEKQNWSHGCVRLNNPDMQELYNMTLLGTKVVIK